MYFHLKSPVREEWLFPVVTKKVERNITLAYSIIEIQVAMLHFVKIVCVSSILLALPREIH